MVVVSGRRSIPVLLRIMPAGGGDEVASGVAGMMSEGGGYGMTPLIEFPLVDVAMKFIGST